MPNGFITKKFFVVCCLAIDMLFPAGVRAQDKVKPIYHIVAPGNTLYGISVMYKVPVQVLREWNNMTNYSIKVGQKLIVGYEHEEVHGTDDSKKLPPEKIDKTVLSESAEKIGPKQKEASPPALVTVEELGFNITQADTANASREIISLFPNKNDTMMNNLLFCGGVDDDRPVGVSPVFFLEPQGKNYIYVYFGKDSMLNMRNFIVDLYIADDQGNKTKLSSTTYTLKPRWKYTVFKHYIDKPGFYEVVVYDLDRKKLGDGQVRILARQ